MHYYHCSIQREVHIQTWELQAIHIQAAYVRPVIYCQEVNLISLLVQVALRCLCNSICIYDLYAQKVPCKNQFSLACASCQRPRQVFEQTVGRKTKDSDRVLDRRYSSEDLAGVGCQKVEAQPLSVKPTLASYIPHENTALKALKYEQEVKESLQGVSRQAVKGSPLSHPAVLTAGPEFPETVLKPLLYEKKLKEPLQGVPRQAVKGLPLSHSAVLTAGPEFPETVLKPLFFEFNPQN